MRSCTASVGVRAKTLHGPCSGETGPQRTGMGRAQRRMRIIHPISNLFWNPKAKQLYARSARSLASEHVVKPVHCALHQPGPPRRMLFIGERIHCPLLIAHYWLYKTDQRTRPATPANLATQKTKITRRERPERSMGHAWDRRASEQSRRGFAVGPVRHVNGPQKVRECRAFVCLCDGYPHH